LYGVPKTYLSITRQSINRFITGIGFIGLIPGEVNNVISRTGVDGLDIGRQFAAIYGFISTGSVINVCLLGKGPSKAYKL
jgi:hypothetical protein